MMRTCCLSCCLVVVLTPGCVKGTETLEILADGTVDMVTRIEGGREDFESGDAMPSPETGWTVEDIHEIDDDGDETITRTASLSVPAGQPLPSSYTASGTALAASALEFPTRVTVERRPDGTYYHFRRVYRARPWADVNYLHRQILEADDVKAIMAKDPSELTDGDRRVMARAFIRLEATRVAVFAELAGVALQPAVPQEAALLAQQRAIATFDNEEVTAAVVQLLEEEDHEPEAEQLESALRADCVSAMRGAPRGIAPRTIAAFMEAYESARSKHEITEDLGDEEWNVFVKMPGRIIAHNGTEAELAHPVRDMDSPEQGDGVTDGFPKDVIAGRITPSEDRCDWSFKGEALRDREVRLFATSFVPYD